MNTLIINGSSIKPIDKYKRNNPLYKRKQHIPLDMSPNEIITKMRKSQHQQFSEDSIKLIKEMEHLQNELSKLTSTLSRVKSLTRIAVLKQEILHDSCKF